MGGSSENGFGTEPNLEYEFHRRNIFPERKLTVKIEQRLE
jgi:hypothetical protein